MLMRVDRDRLLWRSESYDGGDTWTDARPTDIPNTPNKPWLIPLPNGKTALLNTPTKGPNLVGRSPLCLWISDDGLKTFRTKEVLVDIPGALSYPDGFYGDGFIYLTFELNRHDIYFMKIAVSAL